MMITFWIYIDILQDLADDTQICSLKLQVFQQFKCFWFVACRFFCVSSVRGRQLVCCLKFWHCFTGHIYMYMYLLLLLRRLIRTLNGLILDKNAASHYEKLHIWKAMSVLLWKDFMTLKKLLPCHYFYDIWFVNRFCTWLGPGWRR